MHGINTVTEADEAICGIALEESHVLAALSPFAGWFDDKAFRDKHRKSEARYAALDLRSPTYDDCIDCFNRLRDEVVEVPTIIAGSYHEIALRYLMPVVCDVLAASQIQGVPILRRFASSIALNHDDREEDPNFIRTQSEIERGLKDHPDGARGVVEILYSNYFPGERPWRFTSEEYRYVRASLEKEFTRVEAGLIKSANRSPAASSTLPLEASASESPPQFKSKRRRQNEDRDRFAAELKQGDSTLTWLAIAIQTDKHGEMNNADWSPFFDGTDRTKAVNAVRKAVKRFNDGVDN